MHLLSPFSLQLPLYEHKKRPSYAINAELLTEQHLEFLSLKGGCTGSSESTLVKLSHCWKSHVVAHFTMINLLD